MSDYRTDERWIGATAGPYYIEQLLAHGPLGPLFAARHGETQGACLVRILNVPEARTPELQRTYIMQIERHATHVMALQHPAILPLVDFGMERGAPYLVWPQVIMRPLSVRLAQSGPLDVLTVGRYLDQIATALESGYQQATLHRNLSLDCVFLQLDGHILVADFGVRRLVELLGPSDRRHPFYGSLEACAPEQIRGEHIDAYTDVYALGGVTYRLLTGQPIYTGDTPGEIMERHLNDQPRPMANWRDDLPSGLEGVLAGALAKDPVHRFPQASAFANAYHDVVTPNSMVRLPLAGGAPASAQPIAPMDGLAPPHAKGGALPAGEALDGSPPARARPFSRGRGGRPLGRERLIVTVVTVLVLLGSGLFVVYGGSVLRNSGTAGATGTVAFIDGSQSSPGHTDALHIVLHGLSTVASGSHYEAWLINQQSEQATALGALSATDQTGQSYALDYPHAGESGLPQANLLGLGDKIEVTVEQGDVTAPVGHVILVGVFPPRAFVHIRHLLVSFPTTPGEIGLLVGMLGQTQELDAQATALQNAAAAGKTATVRCIAQSMLDIIEGTRGAHYRPLDDVCAALNVTLVGDGFGLLGTAAGDATSGYLDGATDHASLAATQPDATDGIRLHAGHVETAMSNIKGWVTQADQLALQLLATPADAGALSGLVLACDYAYHGRNTNPDQTIDPAPGEAGAQTAYEHGQFMATLALAPSR